MKIAIVGMGLLGRLVALECLRQTGLDEELTIDCYNSQSPIENESIRHTQSVGRLAAGLLGPYTESWHFDEQTFEEAKLAISYWEALSEWLNAPKMFNAKGCLVACHVNDPGALPLFKQRMQGADQFSLLTKNELLKLEPSLCSFNGHLGLLSHEAQIKIPIFYRTSTDRLLNDSQVKWISKAVTAKDFSHLSKAYDWVIDCRGFAAKEHLKDLRGIRGDLIQMWAPDVKLSRPVRFLHPKHPIYIVPIGSQNYVIGTTEIESEDVEPIRARNLMDLLHTAYALHPAFAEARVQSIHHGLRPTLPSGKPDILDEGNRITANGLYRHGYLLGPGIAQQIVGMMGMNASKRAFFKPNTFKACETPH